MTETVIHENKAMQEAWTPRRAVEFAVTIEKMGASFYKQLANKFAHDRDIGDIFSILAEDEADHQKLFEQLLRDMDGDSVPREGIAYRGMPRETTDFFAEMWLLEGIENREDALNLVLQIERKSLDYYLAMRQLMGNNDALTKLIKAEKRHVKKILEYKLTGAKMRGLGDDYKGRHGVGEA